MNREIKFRAWHLKELRWVKGICFGDTPNLLTDGKGILQIMEFIGLYDKNGIPIYEGDIVSIPLYGNVIIIWNKDVCSFQYAYYAIGKGTGIGGRMTNTIYSHDTGIKYEVVGNVYENAELSEQIDE